jgi:hypothetical protein
VRLLGLITQILSRCGCAICGYDTLECIAKRQRYAFNMTFIFPTEAQNLKRLQVPSEQRVYQCDVEEIEHTCDSAELSVASRSLMRAVPAGGNMQCLRT